MKVLHVISNLDARAGGPAVALAGMVAAQRLAGLEISVVSSFKESGSEPAADAMRQQGAMVELVGPATGRLSRHPKIIPTLKHMMANVDIVHIHALWEEVQHQAALLAIEAGTPFVVTPHGMLDPWSLAQHWVRKQAYMLWRLRRTLNEAAALHFTSETERDLVLPMGLKSPAIVEPNGLDLSEFEVLPAKGTFRARYPQIADRPMVLFLSRLHYKKGLELLVPAFAQGAPSQAMLVIAGPDSGGYQAQIEKLVAEQGIADRVIFTGMLHGRERVEAFTDADLFCLPSYQENFGIAVAEALASSCPVLISDKVNIHQQISQGLVGGVVPTEITPLALELKRWLGDDLLRSEAAARARAFVWERYDWKKIALHWSAHYEQMVAYFARKRDASGRNGRAHSIHAAKRIFTQDNGSIPAVHSQGGRPLRVVHVISDVDPSSGGPIIALVGLARAQVAAGIETHILATRKPGSTQPITHYADVFGASAQVIGPTYGRLTRHPAIAATAENMIASADIVHIHALWEEVQYQAVRASVKLGVPYIIRPCGMLDPWSLAQHWIRKQAYMLWRLRRCLNAAAALHFTSDVERDLVIGLGLKAPSVVEPNGVDLSEFKTLPRRGAFRNRYPQIGDRPMVLFLSRLHYKKGLDLLVPAFARVADKRAMLVLAGPDSDGYKARVEATADSFGIADRVIFTGMLHGEARVEAFADADLFCLPSYQENFGIAVVEALAAACPVIISDQVNIHGEITRAGIGGVVPTQVAPLADALNAWLADPQRRAAASAKARPFVWDSYDWEKIALRWNDHYRQLIRASTPILAPAH